MSKQTRYILLSLPNSIAASHHREDALDAIRRTVAPEANAEGGDAHANGDVVVSFPIPEFKIGTLDMLVQQADELQRLGAICESVVGKVADSLRTALDGDEEKLEQMKNINDKPVAQYLRSFGWNKVKYRADKPLSELIDMFQREIASIDNDVRGKFAQYTSVKSTLNTLQRKQTGSLSTKSLASVVDPSVLVQDSEYLETHLIAVPDRACKEFISSYESLCPMVVPRSSTVVASDKEFTLYAVTTFKKYSAEFLQKCREHKWTPRDYKYVEGNDEEERKILDRTAADEKRLWGEVLRLGRTGWSEAAMVWVHVFVLRVFVETVLRYGLPLDYVCALVKTNNKAAPRVEKILNDEYSYLGGNAFSRDKKGRVKKDEGSDLPGNEAQDFTPFVYYEFGF
ncbi:vacuolar ATP synthase subunit C 1 [Ascosphaera apis ARSEF 7405]|uniref:V-type proton ATPase subunit C n=1 Tax=Ascosphaera apis ARSEF 7405 TaxID=392613 RepID=A0A168DPW0_9EURO|nr:vacuolar ATP synthase subunit C 1 [Ascosphaera apis ARSEF 7405]